ncbi:MAG: ACP S-malonyltransferase, partial [Phenylobacterium sp.]
ADRVALRRTQEREIGVGGERAPLVAGHRLAEYSALAGAALVAPRAPVVCNVTAQPTNDAELIRRLLVEQVTGRVRWRESMIWMAGDGGVTRFAEAGTGKVLAGMAKRIAPDAEAISLNAPADLEAFAKSL